MLSKNELLQTMQKIDVTKIVQPGIDVFGVLLMEPVTTVTNLFIAAMSFYAFYMINKNKYTNNTVMFLKIYFLLMGFATAWGGIIGHGFLYALGEPWKLGGWITSMFAVACIERSAISYANRFIPVRLGKFFLLANIIELMALLSLVVYTLHFRYVEYHSAYGLIIVVFSFHSFVFFKTRDLGSFNMIIATISLIAAVYAFNKPLIIDEFFNHRDLAHLFMLLGAYFQYRSFLYMGKTGGKRSASISI